MHCGFCANAVIYDLTYLARNCMNLLAETLEHLNEGARSVRAHAEEITYVITRANDTSYWLTAEEPGFEKINTTSLESYFANVFGIEAMY